MSNNEQLRVEIVGEVLHVTVNRPEKRNALSLDMLDMIATAFRDHRRTDLKCAVLTGAGDRAFVSGGDLKELENLKATAEARVLAERGQVALDEIRYFPVPVIGAINGVALGGGAELAMACDIRIATEQADLGFIQSQLALTTAWGGGIDLIAAVGNPAAMEILCAGQRLTAVDALALRLYSAVCGHDRDFSVFVREYLSRYLNRSANVLRGYKAVAAVRRRKLHDELADIAREQFVAAWVHPDHWDAAANILRK